MPQANLSFLRPQINVELKQRDMVSITVSLTEQQKLHMMFSTDSCCLIHCGDKHNTCLSARHEGTHHIHHPLAPPSVKKELIVCVILVTD